MAAAGDGVAAVSEAGYAGGWRSGKAANDRLTAYFPQLAAVSGAVDVGIGAYRAGGAGLTQGCRYIMISLRKVVGYLPISFCAGMAVSPVRPPA